MEASSEIGYVKAVKNYLIYLDGLPTVRVFDLVISESNLKGLVSTIYPNQVEVLMLDEGTISPGEVFKKTGQTLSIPGGDFLLGRAINPLGIAVDGRGMLNKSPDFLKLEEIAGGIETREFIKEQLVTGITLIDQLIPLGKGQRELVMGDSYSGKTAFLIDLIINQKNSNTICIFAAIGKPINSIHNLIRTLSINKALSSTIILASSSTENAPLIYLTPLTAFALAEYFQKQGKDVLLILDDIGNFAKIYREISLLGGKSPGRESYPPDSFYQLARLMERAGKFNSKYGGGSITALPVIELNLNDFTGFIPTTLMSITDGHLLFKSSLYNKNQRPAIDIALSVSRVGRQTQNLVSSLLSKRIRQILSQAASLETISHFSAELPADTQLVLRQKGLVEEILRQESLTLIPLNLQTMLFGLVFTSFLRDKDAGFISRHKNKLLQTFVTDLELKKIAEGVVSLKSDEDLVQMLEGQSVRLAQIFK